MFGRESLSSFQAASDEVLSAARQVREMAESTLTAIADSRATIADVRTAIADARTFVTHRDSNFTTLEMSTVDTLDAWETAGKAVTIAAIVIAVGFGGLCAVAIAQSMKG